MRAAASMSSSAALAFHRGKVLPGRLKLRTPAVSWQYLKKTYAWSERDFASSTLHSDKRILAADEPHVRTHKRARPITYTSSSEDEVINLTSMDGVIPEGPSVSSLETGRLIDLILDNIAEAEVRRKTCGNIKGEISGKLKNCHLEIIEMARELQARNRTNCGSDKYESLEQLTHLHHRST
ncbi:hypothetical protein M0804_013891 [Polistes exclamans]|nr:hypothetical protein M0804_013891 [Polistes exclamans]